MAKGNKKWWYVLGIAVLILYIILAAGSIPMETTLKPRWITSLESNYPVNLEDFSGQKGDELLPFRIGNRFGYVGDDGKFSINQTMKGYISLAENYWAEYELLPSSVEVMDPHDKLFFKIEKINGYPLFLDNRIFVIGSEQNSITALDEEGGELWSHDFPAPITCIDAAGGYVLAGTLDGAVVLLNSSGTTVFPPFEPGGSRLSVIVGCAISQDASQLAIISGVDDQRFLLMARAEVESRGDTYRVVYHEFISTGFRRPVEINFMDNEKKIVFEREGGIGIYDIDSHSSVIIKLDGEIAALDTSGGDRFLFVITSQGLKKKRFIAIRYPGTVVLDSPFISENTYFSRRNNRIFIGGDLSMISFELEKK